MKSKRILLPIVWVAVLSFTGCNHSPEQNYKTDWLGETKQEIIENIEEQFQGFSRTMMETGYRYQELFWAGEDQNWDYAEYQREHIEEALEQGFVRRPERKLSAQSFMTVALPEIKAAIGSQQPERFAEAFARLTTTCNTCHHMEKVPFMTVVKPSVRHTIIKY